MSLSAYIRLARPGTLVPPLLAAILTPAAAISYYQFPLVETYLVFIPQILAAAFALAGANFASNVANQITDCREDLINKPHRPIPSGEIDPKTAIGIMALGYIFSIGTAAFVNSSFTGLVILILLFTYFYSFPPLRLKRQLHLNQIAIATPRGGLGFLAAWTIVGNPFDPFALLFAIALGIFTFAGNATKDFADVNGDRTVGNSTWPVIYGETKTKMLIATGSSLSILPVLYGSLVGIYNITILFYGPVILLFSIGINLSSKALTTWKLFYISFAALFFIFVITTVFT